MKLNLPTYDAKIRELANGQLQIFDSLRAKYVALTPEEWVRQNFVHFLIAHRAYPIYLMANEVGILHNGCQRRCDTIVYDHSATPLCIVEYKSPEISITSRVFDQIVRYNMVLNVDFLMVSNGNKHFCCRIDHDSGNYVFLKDIPAYNELK